MSNKITWAGPRLLVPITVDALVVTQKRSTTVFSIQSLDLKQKYKQFKPISPSLFHQNEEPPEPGIHLNWALPDGMTKGLVNDKGRVDYPYLPNRWMITRFSPDENVPRKSWIVKSDELYEDPITGQMVNPQFITNNNGQPEIKYIGRWYDLDKFNEEGETAELILTAVGNSDPMFTAYTGNNAFVYSFIDKFEDTNARNISYMVAGWFSNPKFDILYTQPKTGQPWTKRSEWLDTMNRLQWSAGSQEQSGDYDVNSAIEAGKKYLAEQGVTPSEGIEGTYSAQTLCHGLIFNIDWPGVAEAAKSGVPDYDAKSGSVPYVSAANAATDCLAAFMQWQLNFNPHGKKDPLDIHVEKMLEAFSHKMLNQPGGVYDTPELNNAIRESWFGKMPGGTVWVAEAPPKEGELTPEDRSSGSLAQLPANRATELAALNNLQLSYDKKSRELITLQRQLYADWLKLNIYDNTKKKPKLPDGITVNDVLKKSAAAVKDLMDALPREKAAIDAASAELDKKLNGDFLLKEKPSNNFYRPGDPVVLVNNAKRSYKRGEDIIYSDYDDYLFTRYSGQFITCIRVSPGFGFTTVYAKDIFPKLPAHADVPSEVGYLMDEAYLLNPGFAKVIANAVVANPSADFIKRIQMQQTLIWNKGPKTPIDQRTLETLAGFNPEDPLFRIPSKIAVWAWEPAWTPLYLEWEVTFKPKADPALSDWDFDGDDYKWKTNVPVPQPNDTDIFFSGRSLLTPKEAVTVQARLKEFINDFGGNIPPDFVPLSDVLMGAGNWDVLSQTLTGFGMQMMQWDIEQFGRQPQDEYAEGVGNEAHGMLQAGYATNFFPVRAGFVYIKKLWVVDDFGQVYDLNPGKEGLNPIPGIGVRPGNYDISANLPNCFQLPPRVVQGSRLNLNFLSAEDDAILSGQSDETTPVCGWVLPNHLNHSVMVYDKKGTLLGEIMRMGASGRHHAQWIPAPLGGSNTADIANRHLKGFVLGLLGVTAGDEGTPESGKALKNFLQAIDETLWTVDPMGERNNQSLSILVGRPIAVLRASIDLELYGKPGNNLAWEETGQNNDGGIKNYSFPVQIGNLELGQDGVMGYYPNDDYRVFNSVHDEEIKDVAQPPYVTNSFTPVKAGGQPVYITLLLDPRGGIHCSTGILPVLRTELPELYVGKVLDDMLVEFKIGPLLVDKKQWWVPLPAGVGQSWSWLEPGLKDDKPKWKEIQKLVPANAVPQLNGNPQTLVEGRLRLAGVLGGELLILTFEVLEESMPYKVPVNSMVKLSWASQGGVSATLKIGADEPINVPASQSVFEYKVTKTQDLTLTITDGKLGRREQTINIAIL